MEKRARVFLEKAAGYGSVLGLSSIQELTKRLGVPQKELSILHVAGTNGKGSTCCFLQNVLKEAGYVVGLYTSPAVFAYEERFRVNGQNITEREMNDYLLLIEQCCLDMEAEGFLHPTLFEIETALAFLFFRDKHCDLVLLEVGMGGEGDATNVIEESRCSIFTSIGKDHMQFLGNSLPEIARCKAGIIKEQGCAVSIWQEDPVRETLKEVAKRQQASLIFCSKADVNVEESGRFTYQDFPSLRLQMQGSYQLENAVLALEVIRELRKQGVWIDDPAVQRGMEQAFWPGRMECIGTDPLCYLDGAHNVPAAKRLRETLEQRFTNETITYIIGVLADKDYQGMLDLLLPLADRVITITPDNPRALDGRQLAFEIKERGTCAVYASNMKEAAAWSLETGSDVIVAFGSLSYLGEWKRAFCRQQKENEYV